MFVLHKCQSCGAEVNSNMEECPKCGAALPDFNLDRDYDARAGRGASEFDTWPHRLRYYKYELIDFFVDWIKTVLLIIAFLTYLVGPIILLSLLPKELLAFETFYTISVVWLTLNVIVSIPLTITYFMSEEVDEELPRLQKMKLVFPRALYATVFGILFFVILGFLLARVEHDRGRELLGIILQTQTYEITVPISYHHAV